MNFLQSYTSLVVNFLSILTLAGQILAVILVVIIIFRPKAKIALWIEKNALILMFIVALTATCGSLFLSEIAGWTPCKLCWFQRIMMYPQTLLLAVALWKRDRKIAPYILTLCLVGAAISAVHYAEQVSAALNPVLVPAACDLSGVSCASSQVSFAFGYITIPMMALTAFVLIAINAVFIIRRSKK